MQRDVAAGDVAAGDPVAGNGATRRMAVPEERPGRAGGLARLAIAALWVLFGGVALAQPAPQPSSGPTSPAAWLREGFPGGPVGVVGFVAYHTLNVDALNEDIGALNPQVPLLPSSGYAPGFGVLVGIAPRLYFTTAGSELNIERRTDQAFSRLRINDTQVGLYYLARQGPRWRLLVGGLVGLASVEFEWAVREKPECASPADPCFRGSRWSRLMLSLQPEVGLQLALSDSAGLFISAGYLLASDFWNPEWAHGMGNTVRGRPDAFSGPLLKLTLVVGAM